MALPPARARIFWRGPIATLILLLVAAGMVLHAFAPLDSRLVAGRFSVVTRPPSGRVVFVEVDPASLKLIGVWPWPRTVYADLLDRLLALGAGETVFDIDFSSAANAADDRALAAALGRAGGYAALAGFRQLAPGGTRLVTTLPQPIFRAAADTALVNVLAARDGIIRRYPAGMTVGNDYYPSLAELLADKRLAPGAVFDIDYGIDLAGIDRISVADVLEGKVDPARIAGKSVVIGASAQELRDYFTVPRFGTVPGGLLQILAAESLLQGRALSEAGPLPIGVAALLLALLYLAVGARFGFRAQLAALLLPVPVMEAGALLLQAEAGLLVATLPLDSTTLLFALATVVEELTRRRRQHVRAARERDAARRLLGRIITDSLDGVVVVDADGRILTASAVAPHLLDRDKLIGERAAAVLPELVANAVAQALAAEPTAPVGAPAEITIGPPEARRALEYALVVSEIVEGETARRVVCLTLRDITERRRSEAQLAFLARHDSLTGALSRAAFVETVGAMLASDAEHDRGLTVFAIDLGGFGRVNELHGYAAGDAVLREAGERLERLAPGAVGRIGGDSFALARRGSVSAETAGSQAEELLTALTQPYNPAGQSIVLSAHIGITNSDASGFAGEQLLADADMALASGKAAPGSSVFFSPALLERFVVRQRLETGLREAIAKGRLVVHYQPQIELSSGRLAGVEALVRWDDPERGIIVPAEFIAVAEETGLIVELGRFVMTRACRDFADWPDPVRVAVNVSPVQFRLDDVATMVRLAATEGGLDPSRLEVEITEGVFMQAGEGFTEVAERLRLMGVEVALDDFGTGYSSLGQLDRLEVDTLKIDRGFIAPLPDDSGRLAIVTAMLTLARSLDKRVVAEGIETAAQADLLRRLGCGLGQGYYFDRPLPIKVLRQRYLKRPRLTVVARNG
jgi:diguanylate cyclase (GGDEF)-like protein